MSTVANSTISAITNSSINVVVQNPSTINYSKDLLLPLIGTLLGVIIGALLSYLFNQINEKKLLKIKIELDIAEELLKLKKDPQTHYIINDLKTMLDDINNLIISNEDKEPDGTNSIAYNIKGNIFNSNIENLSTNWSNNKSNLNAIVQYMEARAIPLRRFVPFTEKFIGTIREMLDLWDSFYSKKYQNIIKPAILFHNIIENDVINSFVDEYMQIENKYIDILAYYRDLEVALQNIFIGDLYNKKYKLSFRKPIDPKYTVIKPLEK